MASQKRQSGRAPAARDQDGRQQAGRSQPPARQPPARQRAGQKLAPRQAAARKAAARKTPGPGTASSLAAGTAATAGRPGAADAASAQLPAAPAGRKAANAARPTVFTLVTFLLSLLGLGVSIYLTVAHYSSVPLACSDKGLVNCQAVTTSSQSVVFGIFPVAVLGLAFYLFMTAINSPWGWRLTHPLVARLRLASVVVGMLFVLYLVYAELIQIGNICLWCTSVHVITFLLFALMVFHAAARPTVPAASRR